MRSRRLALIPTDSGDVSRDSTCVMRNSFERDGRPPYAGGPPRTGGLTTGFRGSTNLGGQGDHHCRCPPVLAGAGPPYPAALVGRVAEPEGVASLVLGEPVVALRAGVGVAGVQAGEDRRPPRLDRRRQPVHLRRGRGRGVGIERLEPTLDGLPVR